MDAGSGLACPWESPTTVGLLCLPPAAPAVLQIPSPLELISPKCTAEMTVSLEAGNLMQIRELGRDEKNVHTISIENCW